MGETDKAQKVAWVLAIENAILNAETPLAFDLSQVIRLLFALIDGPNKEEATAAARAWLEDHYGDACGEVSRFMLAVDGAEIEVEAEWPAEIDAG
jgi:hypothetical protein